MSLYTGRDQVWPPQTLSLDLVKDASKRHAHAVKFYFQQLWFWSLFLKIGFGLVFDDFKTCWPSPISEILKALNKMIIFRLKLGGQKLISEKDDQNKSF